MLIFKGETCQASPKHIKSTLFPNGIKLPENIAYLLTPTIYICRRFVIWATGYNRITTQESSSTQQIHQVGRSIIFLQSTEEFWEDIIATFALQAKIYCSSQDFPDILQSCRQGMSSFHQALIYLLNIYQVHTTGLPQKGGTRDAQKYSFNATSSFFRGSARNLREVKECL